MFQFGTLSVDKTWDMSVRLPSRFSPKGKNPEECIIYHQGRGTPKVLVCVYVQSYERRACEARNEDHNQRSYLPGKVWERRAPTWWLLIPGRAWSIFYSWKHNSFKYPPEITGWAPSWSGPLPPRYWRRIWVTQRLAWVSPPAPRGAANFRIRSNWRIDSLWNVEDERIV